MGQGYWVECIPLQKGANQNLNADLYSASSSAFPEIHAYGGTPDAAIEKLRAKLTLLKRRYASQQKPLPLSHNPMNPTNRLRYIEGWMSVYIEEDDRAAG